MQTNTSASPAAGPAAQVPGTDPEALTVGARVGRIIGVLVSPVKTFHSIAGKPSWLAPLVLWILAAGVTSAIVTPKMDFQAMMRQRMAQRGVVMSDQQMQQAVAIQQRFRWIGEVAAVVMPVIIAGLVSLLFFAAFAAAGQKSMSYGQSFAVTTHAFVPQSLAGFATAIVAAGMTTINPMALGDLLCSSPACFASGTLAPATHAVLQALDIYVIWTLVLMTIGYAAAARVSRTLTGSVVVVVWVLYVIGKVALSGFFG
ncbi:MAG TPA: YIP1 family protein [Vicinamibacterales bacterium]|jgi:hypothetical protein